MGILDFIKDYSLFEGFGVVVVTGLFALVIRMWRKNSGKDEPSIQGYIKTATNIGEDSLKKNVIEYYTALNDDFARSTIRTRFKAVYSDNNLGEPPLPETVVNITTDDFFDITPDEVSKHDENYPNLVKYFLDDMQDYIGLTLSEFYHKAPFILVEHYFYYKILLSSKDKSDPYRETKLKSLTTTKDEIAQRLSAYENLEIDDKNAANKGELLRRFVIFSLFGNTTDLSQIVYRQQLIKPDILKDQFVSLLEYLSNKKSRKIDILADNTGIELLSDIILSLVLIELGYTRSVHFHVNILPVFVSDIIKSEYGDDFQLLFNYLDEIGSSISAKFNHYLDEGKILIKPNFFWNMPNDFKNYNHIFMKLIGRSDLVIIKGDLNFRRLVEDKSWQSDQKLGSLISYLKTPCLVLRTIKSSTIVDLDSEMIEKLQSNVIEKTNGKYGTILFNNG